MNTEHLINHFKTTFDRDKSLYELVKTQSKEIAVFVSKKA